jgi:hypothetical protein
MTLKKAIYFSILENGATECPSKAYVCTGIILCKIDQILLRSWNMAKYVINILLKHAICMRTKHRCLFSKQKRIERWRKGEKPHLAPQSLFLQLTYHIRCLRMLCFQTNCRKSRTNKIFLFLQSGVCTKYLWFASKFLEPYGWQRSDVNNKDLQNQWGTRWLSSWGTALQTGRSRDRFPMVSLEFFNGIILPAALWHWGRLSL